MAAADGLFLGALDPNSTPLVSASAFHEMREVAMALMLTRMQVPYMRNENDFRLTTPSGSMLIVSVNESDAYFCNALHMDDAHALRTLCDAETYIKHTMGIDI